MAPHRILFNELVHKRIKWAFGLYLAISLIMLWVLVYKTIYTEIGANVAVVGVLVGVVIGILLSRMLKIYWSDSAGKVLSRIDTFGLIVLILFFAFDFFHPKLVGLFVYGEDFPLACFAILTGVVYGRVLGFRGSIYRVLKQKAMLIRKNPQ